MARSPSKSTRAPSAGPTIAANPIAQANVGGEAYVLDDNTVSLLATGRSIAGIIFQVDVTGVWVTTTP